MKRILLSWIFLSLLPAIVGLRGVAAESALEVSAWVIGASRDRLSAGEVVRVGVQFAPAAGASAGGVTLTGKGADWRGDVVVELVPANGGQPVVARLHGSGNEKNVTTTAEQPARGVWWIPSQQVVPGDFQVRVRWVAQNANGALPVRVVATDATRDPAATVLAQAYEAVLDGKLEDAAKRVDAVLAKDASSVELLTFRALLCLEVGDVASANVCLARADLLARKAGGEPSISLFELRRRLEAGAEDGNAVSGAAPAASATEAVPGWSRPPDAVFRALDAPPVEAAAVPSGNASTSAATTTTPARSTAAAAPAMKQPATVAVAAVPAPSYASVVEGVVVSGEVTDAKALADTVGQWASGATASSEYGAPNYAAMQATGVPNVKEGGDSTFAWCPGSSAKGIQWLELTFPKAVQATEVRVRQNYNPGAIVRIEAIDAEGGAHLWWSGVDPARPPGASNVIAWFAVRVPETSYRVAKIKVTLDIDAVASWQEVDAVQLVGR